MSGRARHVRGMAPCELPCPFASHTSESTPSLVRKPFLLKRHFAIVHTTFFLGFYFLSVNAWKLRSKLSFPCSETLDTFPRLIALRPMPPQPTHALPAPVVAVGFNLGQWSSSNLKQNTLCRFLIWTIYKSPRIWSPHIQKTIQVAHPDSEFSWSKNKPEPHCPDPLTGHHKSCLQIA